MKKIALSVMAVVQVPDGTVAARSRSVTPREACAARAGSVLPVPPDGIALPYRFGLPRLTLRQPS
jgi:hypothetical protein